jgi:hypothetical protein
VTVPAAAERLGDFSNSRNNNNRNQLIIIRDPRNSRAPFPGNVIPPDRIDRNGQNYLNLLPLTNFFNTALSANNYNYQVQESLWMPKTMETLRADYQIDRNTTVYGRFNYWWENQQGWAVAAGNTPWGWLPNTYRNWTKSFALSATRILGPLLIVEGSTSVSRWLEAGPAIQQADLDRLNRKNAGFDIPQFHPENNPYNLAPAATFGGISQAANPSYTGRFPLRGAETVFLWNAAATKTSGPHVSKLGLYAERWRAVKGENGTFAGQFKFDQDTNNPNDAGDAYANALLGNFSQYTESTTRPPTYEYTTSIEWFAQDNWKITRRLTLDLGVRWGWSQPFHSNRRQEAGFLPERWNPSRSVLLMPPVRADGARLARNPITGEILPAALIGAIVPGAGNPFNGTVDLATDNNYPDGLRNTTGIKTAPRFGFAYDPFGKGRTAIRGGVGIFYEIHEKDNWSNNFALDPPRQLNPVIYYGNLKTFLTAPEYNFPSGTNGIDRGRALGRTMSYSFGIQQNIGFGTVIDASYVGSLGRHLMERHNLNSTPLGANFLATSIDSTNNRPLPSTFLRRYIGYNDILYYSYDGNSSYHSLQLSANRRLTKGIQFGVAWTWSKAMDYADSETGTVSNQVDPRVWNYGKAGFDRTHIVKMFWIYNLPRARWRNAFARGVLDGWQVSGINTFMSGAPTAISLNYATGLSRDISGSTDGARVLVIENPILPKGDRTFDRTFNEAAFRVPPPGTWGNAPKDVFRGPGINNWDISMFKNFRLIKERWRAQFRGEFYNAWNHTQFSSVNTSPQFDQAGNASNPLFGQYTASRLPRRVQMALRVSF